MALERSTPNTRKHNGDLRVTPGNLAACQDISEVSGYVDIRADNASLSNSSIYASPTWRLLKQHGKKVPDHLWPGIVRYVDQGVAPGLALRSIFNNDLKETIVWGDTQVQVALGSIVRFIYNRLPLECQGSKDAVDAWIKQGGLQIAGRDAA